MVEDKRIHSRKIKERKFRPKLDDLEE
jgi:hypothetical protein